MARHFNGTSDFIAVDAARLWSPTTAFSFVGWINGGTQQNKKFYCEGLSSTPNGVLNICSQNGSPNNKLRGVIIGSGGATRLLIISSAVVLDSTWHHIAYTQDASLHAALYVDGAADTTGTITTDSFAASNRVSLGVERTSTNSNFFSGDMGHAATWSRQLAALEIKAMAAGIPPSKFAANHYWPLWGADSPEPDIGIG